MMLGLVVAGAQWPLSSASFVAATLHEFATVHRLFTISPPRSSVSVKSDFESLNIYITVHSVRPQPLNFSSQHDYRPV